MRDNYKPDGGFTFEHTNFYLSLKNFPGTEVIYFPFDKILEIGKDRFNKEILSLVKDEKPDLVFCFMVSDELALETLDEMKKHATTVAWFADDSWRFWNYSRFYGPHFTWVVTTYSWMPALYKRFGQPNIIRSQWAANTNVYKPDNTVNNKDRPAVSFVGGWTKPRQRIISKLKREGVMVSAYGSGWPLGRVSEEKMIQIFSSSKINLGLNPPPGFLNKNSLGRLFFRRSVNKIVPDIHIARNIKMLLHRGIPQIKARHFEIPACGGFLITQDADDLGKYYRIGEEIVTYKNINDLAEKIQYHLNNDDARRKIARAGYERTIKEHTYQKRFEEIFKLIGFSYVE